MNHFFTADMLSDVKKWFATSPFAPQSKKPKARHVSSQAQKSEVRHDGPISGKSKEERIIGFLTLPIQAGNR
jgi:hypothetical protein